MSLAIWILIGAFCGLLADFLARSFGLLEDVIVGIVGSVVAGWVLVVLTGEPLTGATLLHAAAALIGAVSFILVSRTLTRGRGMI